MTAVRLATALFRSPPLQSCLRSLPVPKRLSSTMTTIAAQRPYNASWQQTMLRVKDPEASLSFYRDLLGFELIHSYKFDDFSLYFIATLPEGVTCPNPGTKEAEQFLWTMPYTCLELTHNHGTEKEEGQVYDSGNNEPKRGFGHVAIYTNDVYQASEQLEAKGVSFKKRPDEGRMKGLAFAYDPDGYWVEIIKREPALKQDRFTLSQTMLRVKDVEKSLNFYRDCLGMTVCRERHFPKDKGDFSLYFLAHLEPGTKVPTDPEEANTFIKGFDFPVLELTHNHGTESDPNFHHHDGNSEPRGFGHVGFLVDDLETACNELEAKGYSFKKKPSEGKMHSLAFVYDPDGYWVELIQRGASF
eukprot:m.45756 g.45756  ORF g.45756 m.45756 type:complete len:358 (-) comp13104_c0_seq2:803-1876(-)